MKSYALALVSSLARPTARFGALAFGAALVLGASGCSFGDSGDYQVAVSWLINGTTPSADLCAEQRIARARFEVRTGGGKRLKTIEANCADTIELSDGFPYGGFLTTPAFEWDVDYYFTLTLVDAAGVPVTMPGEGSFNVFFDSADIYELGYLDYVQPFGAAASLSGEWSVRGGGDVAAACSSERIQSVGIWAASSLDENREQAIEVGKAPCADGKFVSNGKLLARGSYFFWYEAVSNGDSVVEVGDPIEVLVDGASDVKLPRETFLSN